MASIAANSVDAATAGDLNTLRARLARFGQGYGPAVVLAAAAILQQVFGHVNTDNSWLITLCERVLNGATPYVDFIEVNPPASILLYLPWVALARAIGVRPELVATAS